jgi:hypothetical protein
LTPIAVGGIVMLVPGGITLFIADAGPLAANSLLRVKLSLAGVGIINALAFRALWRDQIVGWDASPPALGRAQAALSIAIWITVPVLGRMIAYL